MPTYDPTIFTSKSTLLANIPTRIYQNFLRYITGTVHQQMDMDMAASLWREFTAPLSLDTATGVVKLTDGTAGGNVYQWNSTTSTWNQVQAKTGKIIWVDGTYGVDAAAQVYNPFRPFLTLDAAQTAATSGDLIHVRPGAYTTTGIGKNGVNWYFDAGATVTGIITDAGTAKSFTIYGQGVFTNSTAGSTVSQSNASSVTTIYAKSISNTLTGGSANAVQCTAGVQTVYATLSSTGSIGYGVTCGGGTQTIYGDVYGQSIGVSCSGSSTQYIYGNVTSATRGVSLNAGSRQVVYGDVTAPTAYAGAVSGSTRITGLVTGILDLNSVATVFLEIQHKAVIPSAVQIGSGQTLVLGGAARLVSTAGTNCATGVGTIISYGAYATLAANVSVTVTGTLNVGSYVQ